MSRRTLLLLAACLLALNPAQCDQTAAGSATEAAEVSRIEPWSPQGSATGSPALLAPSAAPLERRRRHYGAPPLGEDPLGCDDIGRLDAGTDLCAFVRDHCASESLVDWPRLYYCHVAAHGPLATALLLAGCAALLALLFRVIARAADDFFSCILSQISQDLGLPPRLGGVTLLALGNGAPDLSASIAAVKTGNYQLAMGALTGAGMFVGGVVAGRIVSLSGGVRARGAQLRDIATQFITVVVITGIVASGWFTYHGVAALLSIYFAYVVVVAVADFSKRAGVEWGEVARIVSRRMSSRWRMEMVAPLLREDYGTGAEPPPLVGANLLSGLAAGEDETGGRQMDELPGKGGPGPAAPAAAGTSGPAPRTLGLAPAGSAPPPPGVGAPGLPRFSSLPDLEGQRRQQQEAYWHPQQADQARQGHARQHPPVAQFHPRVTYSDLVQMPAREYRQRALAEMAQSRSFYARDRRSHEEEEADEREAAAGGSWEESSHGGDSSSEEESDVEQGQQRGGAQPSGLGAGWATSQGGSGGTHSGSSRDAYRPPLVSYTPQARRRSPDDSASLAAAAAAAVAEVDAERRRLAQQAAAAAGEGQQQGEEQRAGLPAVDEESAELRPLAKPNSSNSNPSTASTANRSINSFEMATGADAVGSRSHSPPLRSPSPLPEHGPSPAAGDVSAWAEDAGEGGGLGARLQRLAEAAQWPLLMLLQATIPLVEVNSYRRPWFLRALAASPLFVAAYLHLFSWQAVLVALAAGAALAGAGHLGTRGLGGKAPLWRLGTGYPIGAALVAVYGFGIAAMWISLFASEIVGLLQFFGMLSKVDPAVLGVTVLAWGNSLMDYLNNTAMAGRSRGGNSMAMTACFAGPLFNMLVGLGLGFWALLQESGAARAAVEMDPVVLTGLLFIMANCAGLVGVSLAHRQHLPAWCGAAMVGLYCAYLAVVLAVIVIT